VSFNPYLFTPNLGDSSKTGSTASHARVLSPAKPGTATCPGCRGDVAQPATPSGWQNCPYCGKKLQITVWTVVRANTNADVALSDQATCFFHPEKAYQACCQRCGRFVCALCDLQLGAEHICPACFERGRGNSGAGADAGKAEWRHRDVLYDSIALTVGWGWILFWPTIVAAIPTVIVLHIKYRKAPRSSLIPRYGWRFWMAYVGLAWLPALLAMAFLFRSTGRP
jgi:hypothetical protein